jgi:hypothetical protein
VNKGVVLHDGDDVTLVAKAAAARLPLTVSDEPELVYDKTLIAEAGTRVPWDLLPSAWHFLERWDAALPLWRYGVTAADVGTTEERSLTEAVIGDLRVLLHSVELLFARKNEAGSALVELWRQECAGGGDKRLAFLRSLHRVKPRLCVLPVSWLAEVQQQSLQAMARPAAGPGRSPNAGRGLVRLELEPGRLVKCHAGDEQRVLAHFERQRKARGHHGNTQQ